MRYQKFKKELKNEFNNTFNEESIEFQTKELKRPFRFKLAFTYLLIIGLIGIFGFFAGNYLYISIHNSNVINNIEKKTNDLNNNDCFNLLTTKDKDLLINLNDDKLYSVYNEMIPEVSTAEMPLETQKDSAQIPSSSHENNQVEGVSEADIAKTDGKYIYYICMDYNSKPLYDLVIYDLKGNQLIKEVVYDKKDVYNACDLQIYEDKIIIYFNKCYSIYSFDGEKLNKIYYKEFENVLSSRLIDNNLYMILNYKINDYEMNDCYYNDFSTHISNIIKISKINLDDMEEEFVDVAANGYSFIYMDKDYVVIPTHVNFKGLENNETYYYHYTLLNVFTTDLKPVASFKVNGFVLNQYSIDVYENTLRVVSYKASIRPNEINNLTIFDIKGKEKFSSLTYGLGEGYETVKSVSFEDTICYVVTYMNTDPLYEIDISDPLDIRILSRLKVPGYSSYTYRFNVHRMPYLLGLGVTDDGNKKISVYEVENGENIQIGKDFVILYKRRYYEDISNELNADLALDNILFDVFDRGIELFLHTHDERLYLGCQLSYNTYYLFKIDVMDENPISLYESFETTNPSRLFLINGKFYIPTKDKLIIEEF